MGRFSRYIGEFMNKDTFKARYAGSAIIALTMSLLASPAFAQDAGSATTTPAAAGSDTGEIITVIGSRISRSDLQAASPVKVVDAETLKVTNTATTESYLTQLPQFVPGITGSTNNGANGFATVDLRSLGPKRTLVLIDGHRMVPGDINGAVDINAIPSALVKRVEILTGGASAVYGADAIAGVVNFVLDDQFTGITADASDQLTDYHDGSLLNADVVGGTNLGPVHVVLSGQYTKREGVYQSARGYSSCCTLSSNTVPTAIDINSGRYQVNNAGNFVPYYQSYNINPANYLMTPLEKYSFMGLLTAPVTDNISFYLRGSYAHSKVTEILAPTATGGYNFTISPTNPFLNAANTALIFGDPANLNPDGTANVGIRRRIVETQGLGGRIIAYSSKVSYVAGGFKGDIGDDFKWEVFAQYGVTNEHQDLLNDISYNRTQQALNAVNTPNGIACADPSGGCAPLNLFTTATIPSNALNFILENGAQDNHYTQFVTGGNVAGTLGFLKSPWAEKAAAVSVGVEYRKETGNQLVSSNYSSGDMIYFGQGTAVPSASFNVKEIFGEINMPVVTDKPFFQSLNIEGGIRYSSYSNSTIAGNSSYGAVTFKAGGDWTPVEGLRLRAIFNRAIRDPDIFELNSPLVQGSTDVLTTDPCSGGAPHGNASLAAKCIAQGAPAAVVNNGIIQDVIANQVNALTGGNPKLRPETADTWTIGAVISPPSIPGLHVTVDYYRVNLKNSITADTAQDIFNQCFTNSIDSFCSLIQRNTINGQLSGSITSGVVESLLNLSGIKTSGVDVSADYRLRLPHESSLTFAINGTYVAKWEFRANSASAPFECAGKFGNTCDFGSTIPGNLSGNPIPKWKHVASVTYDSPSFGLYLAWRYISPVDPDSATDAPHIPSYSWFDATASFKVAQKFTFRLGVQNMFNIDPPIVGGAAGSSSANSGNTFPQVYDPLGRTFFASVNVKL